MPTKTNTTHSTLYLHDRRDKWDDSEMWVCPTEDLMDVKLCKPGTPGGMPKPTQLHKVRIGCNGLRCPHDHVYVDVGKPKFTRTCPRQAVVAAAHWRNYCFLEPDTYEHPALWCIPATPYDETFDGPGIDRCCGEWVDVNDPYLQDYPTAQKNDGTYYENMVNRDGEFRRVIKPNPWEFNTNEGFCRTWMAESEAVFQYFMQNLESWLVSDADLLGHGGPRFHIKWDTAKSRGLPDSPVKPYVTANPANMPYHGQ
ncbi:uncharacterized protein Z519_04594 [Cladophialophora bantiana CBS 173.52]|uniref:Uncharacterized protein n=1 Tax=Cladophialophora bantiana (strain ATCC 10958 / CBS 173.52 / CDC B-1940 / NIH 8579) TaxID=1442370 RepID=A0A0D2HMN1_CLAB1|nr:uncharacterized protein Z519_04594 [Cladophialophora bantiana CBS 173.52]KIW94618.1 hypothetical protein Z519_04594 [Cladophialophora bantiana CBS 173.52]